MKRYIADEIDNHLEKAMRKSLEFDPDGETIFRMAYRTVFGRLSSETGPATANVSRHGHGDNSAGAGDSSHLLWQLAQQSLDIPSRAQPSQTNDSDATGLRTPAMDPSRVVKHPHQSTTTQSSGQGAVAGSQGSLEAEQASFVSINKPRAKPGHVVEDSGPVGDIDGIQQLLLAAERRVDDIVGDVQFV